MKAEVEEEGRWAVKEGKDEEAERDRKWAG